MQFLHLTRQLILNTQKEWQKHEYQELWWGDNEADQLDCLEFL
jgi:hypothetical protein